MIKLENVSFSYRQNEKKENPVLSGINLTISKGEFVSVIGNNGSGKSTLSLLLNGLLVPDSGHVTVDNLGTLIREDIEIIRSKVGLLFQNPDNQIIASVVEEDVAFGPQNLGLERDEIIKRVENSLAKVELTDFSKHDPNTLSAGQKQKVALAGLLALNPKYLVLDEPTSYLDPFSSIEIMNIVKDLCYIKQITVVNITHDPNQLFLGQRVLLLDKGKIVFDGDVDGFFDNDEHLNLSGFSKPLWYDIKTKIKSSNSDIINVNSNEELADYLCSLN